MKVSIIVPVYNTENYLEKCVESLCHQTHKDLQILLVNDGSEDNSLKLMEELAKKDSRIEVIDKEHSGLAATKNVGLNAVKGDYVSFIDSDDWIDLNMYEVMLRQIEEHGADAVYCEWKEEYSDGTSELKGRDGTKKIVLKNEEILDEFFRNKIYMRTSSGLLSMKMIGDLRFHEDLQPGEEMLFGLLALGNAKCVVYTNIPFYHRYNRLGSISNQSGFRRTDLKRAISTDRMVQYVEADRPQHLLSAYGYCFTFYMTTLNRMVYYRAQKDNLDIYNTIKERLRFLYREMKNPRKVLANQVYYAYRLFLVNKAAYYVLVKIYYKYVKKQFDSKRQK